jgi:Homeodomain-like domain
LCLANTASGKIRLTSAPSLAILRAMRHLVRAVAAIGFALSTRRDLLLEILALRHQLRVLVRSNRRFRPSDRLLWLVLRRSWPRWRDALVLVQPATVDRWHRDGLHLCWHHRRSRRPGRPRIDSACRALIQRLAQENLLWGAPRIHGELRKLGIVVSERTVSRYLRGLPRAPSQTWRTFLVNHLAQCTFMSPAISPYAPGGDDVVDVFGLTSRQNPLLRDGAVTSHQRAIADWRASLQRESLGKYIVQDHLDDRIVIRKGSSRGPPTPGRLRTKHGVCSASGLVLMHWTSATTASDHRSRTDGRPPCQPHRRRTTCSDSVYTSAWVIHIAVGELARHNRHGDSFPSAPRRYRNST